MGVLSDLISNTLGDTSDVGVTPNFLNMGSNWSQGSQALQQNLQQSQQSQSSSSSPLSGLMGGGSGGGGMLSGLMGGGDSGAAGGLMAAFSDIRSKDKILPGHQDLDRILQTVYNQLRNKDK